MTDISRHIEYLLLEHDTVSVPRLGTFHIQVSASRWVSEEDLFLPPVRNVSFTADVDSGDDSFVRSLAAALRVSTEQAQAACAEYVESIRQELAANSVAEVGSIGMFVRDAATGTDCFMPCQAGVTSPEFYGLDSVYQPRLPESVRQAESAAQVTAQARNRDDKHVTIRIPRSLLYYASAAAAAIIVFLSFSTPATYTSPEVGSSVATANLFLPANLLPSAGVSQDLQVADTVKTTPTRPVSAPSQPSANAAPAQAAGQPREAMPLHEPMQRAAKADAAHCDGQRTALPESTQQDAEPQAESAAPQAQQQQEATQAEYAVVLASAVSTANAERYVKDLNSRDIKAELQAKGNMTRVIVTGFKTMDEAYGYVRRIRAASSEFDSAWVLKL